NLMYSELNFLWEAWLGVFTNNEPEAVVNKSQRKGLPEYQALMEAAFLEFYRLLKPGGWMTVEFHNSKNAVWNAIQEAILRAGFMLADVRTLDKQQGTFKQVTSTAAVKQDLIISAYKPAGAFEQRFLAAQGSVEGAWAFIRQHLEHLAMPTLAAGGMLTFIGERAPYLLYDRMVAYHIQRGLSVPLSAPEFYAGLNERFAEREGMIFTFPQAAEFDKLRILAERVEQLPLFITDEKSAIQWLRRALDPAQGGGPRTYSDLANDFKKELHKLSYEALPELRDLLDANFLQDAAGRWYLPDPSKASDLYALREKSLLREFALYTKGKRRLKTFRLEAVRAGFRRAWQDRDYKTIVNVADRLPPRVFEDDPQLMMYADNARLRLDAQPRQERLL
ncbi:MAG: DNA methylase, partial [Gammaproteobacteria bacterium]